MHQAVQAVQACSVCSRAHSMATEHWQHTSINARSGGQTQHKQPATALYRGPHSSICAEDRGICCGPPTVDQTAAHTASNSQTPAQQSATSFPGTLTYITTGIITPAQVEAAAVLGLVRQAQLLHHAHQGSLCGSSHSPVDARLALQLRLIAQCAHLRDRLHGWVGSGSGSMGLVWVRL